MVSKVTNRPYKLCNFAVGSGEDFICVRLLAQRAKGWLHSW